MTFTLPVLPEQTNGEILINTNFGGDITDVVIGMVPPSFSSVT
jgi:hypothetical protein